MSEIPDPRCDDERIHAYGVTLEALGHLGRIFDQSLRQACGIGANWFEALLRIERSGGRMSMGELAEQVTLTSGGVTRLVDRLVEAGLVERLSCDHDRRVQYAVMTDSGRQMLAEALTVHLEDLEAHFNSKLTSSEREVISEVFDRMRPVHS